VSVGNRKYYGLYPTATYRITSYTSMAIGSFGPRKK
jgi:hypothetical protein